MTDTLQLGASLLAKLPPVFPAKTLEDASDGVITARQLNDYRREKRGPAYTRVPGGRKIIYTREAVARWLSPADDAA
jgi:hypothetical protein